MSASSELLEIGSTERPVPRLTFISFLIHGVGCSRIASVSFAPLPSLLEDASGDVHRLKILSDEPLLVLAIRPTKLRIAPQLILCL